jgi:hypothetical protein
MGAFCNLDREEKKQDAFDFFKKLKMGMGLRADGPTGLRDRLPK